MRMNSLASRLSVGFCVCLLLIVFGNMGIAQERELNHMTILQVKPGMGPAFENLMKTEIVPALRKGGVVSSGVWKTAILGQGGQYIMTQTIENYAGYDEPNPIVKGLGQEEATALIAKLQEYVRNVSMSVILMRPDLGAELPEGYVPKLGLQVKATVVPGYEAEFEKAIKAAVDLVKKTNAKGAYAGEVIMGGNPYEYHTVVLLDSFTDMDTYTEAFSKYMSEANLRSIAGILAKMEYNIYSYIPELSIQATE